MIKNNLNKSLELNLILTTLLIVIIFPNNFSNSQGYKLSLDIFVSLFIVFISLSFLLILFTNIIKTFFEKFKLPFFFLDSLIKFIFIWVFLTGNFFPVTGEHDPFLNLSLPIGKKLELILKFLFFLFIFFLLEKNKFGKLFYRFIVIYILINLLFVFIKVDFNKNEFVNKKINKFGNKNLIVLSFDGITGKKMLDEVKLDRELNSILKDFTFYTNVTTAWPATNGSMNAELNGSLTDKGNKNYFNNILNDNKLDISVYSYYSNRLINQNKGVQKGTYKKYSNSFYLNQYLQIYFIGSTGRWGTPLIVMALEPIFYSSTYKSIINFISPDKNKLNPFAKINTVFYTDLFEYDMIVDDFVYDKNLDNTVRMYHFSFSHWPVLVDDNCEEVKTLNAPPHEHEKIVIRCISKKIKHFLYSLKKNDLYKRSMVIIKSDHGKPNYVQKSYSTNFIDFFKKRRFDKYYKDHPYNLKINDSFYWGYGRYKPFIMIKDQNIENESIVLSNKHVFLHDLSSTYCNFYYNSEYCKKYKRNNLSKNENLFKDYIYDIYLPKNSKSFSSINDFDKYEISNQDTLINFLERNNIKLNQ